MDFVRSATLGEVTKTLVSVTNDPFKTHAVSHLNAELEGIVGDRHFGHTRPSGGREKNQFKRGTMIPNHRQWSALSEEEMAVIAQSMGLDELPPESIAANLLIKGIPAFSQLPPFTRLVIGEDQDVVLLVYEMNKPCDIPMPHIKELASGSPTKNFSKAAKDLRGLVGWVEKAGVIKPGSPVAIWLPKAYPGIEHSQWL